MKSRFPLVILLSVLLVSFSKRNKDPYIDISALSMNITYAEISNPITIYGHNQKVNSLIVSAQGVKLKKVKPTKATPYFQTYLAIPKQGTKEFKIVVSNKKGKVLKKHTFRVRRVPVPIVQMGGVVPSDEASQLQLFAQRTMIANTGWSFPYALKYKVPGFEVVAYTSEGRIKLGKSSSDVIDENISRAIRKLNSGDAVVIQNITTENEKYGIKHTPGPVTYILR